jgi:hypothetical protein
MQRECGTIGFFHVKQIKLMSLDLNSIYTMNNKNLRDFHSDKIVEIIPRYGAKSPCF